MALEPVENGSGGCEEGDLFGKAAEVKAHVGKGVKIVEDEVPIAGGVDGVGSGRGEGEFFCGDGAVEGECRAGNST